MSELLTGKALVCSAYDPSGLIVAMTMSVLRGVFREDPVKIQLIRNGAPAGVLSTAPQAGFAFWRVSQQSEILPVCQELIKGRGQSKAIGMIYLAPELAHFRSALVEAGAQLAISEVPSWQQALLSMGRKLPLSHHGFHPLTSGLTQRLPWPELED